jgi:hypothetical protein
MRIGRRQVTGWGACSLLAMLDQEHPLLATSAVARTGQVPWYARVKRIGQTNFNERDPEFGDVEAWADYWASVGAQAVALSVSGPVAFYPTKVPFFHVSAYLNGRDLFGECLAAAKKRKLRVFGRMSPDIQFIDPPLLAAHPDWFRRSQEGELQQPAPEIAYTCQFSANFTEQQPRILRELTTRYDIDGIYMNGWPTLQRCFCAKCRTIGDPGSDTYRKALLDRAIELTDLYRSIVVRRRSDAFYSCNVAGGLGETGLDTWQLTRHANWYTADNQARSGMDQPVWENAQQVKLATAMMGHRPVAAVTAAYTRGGDRMWRQATDTSYEPIARMAQTAAAGGAVWYHQLGLTQGFREDRRWQAAGREFLSWHARHDAHFHNLRSLANVAIVLPMRSMAGPSEREGRSTDHLQGMYAALLEARIPFDFVHENELSEQRLAAYDLLILPNFSLMSDRQAASLRAYAQQGGSIFSTFQTGLFDEDGRERPDFALGALFGIARTKPAIAPPPPTLGSTRAIGLMRIRSRGPLTVGFEDTEWLAGASRVQPITATATATVPLTVISPYPIYPPEAVYQREPETDMPALVVQQRGRSRLAYFASDIDASYWRLDNPDLGKLIGNTLTWLLADKRQLRVEGAGLMEVIAWKTEPGYAIHLLNYNAPNAFRGHMRRPLDLGSQQLTITVEQDSRIGSATLLSNGRPIDYIRKDREIAITIPSVGPYEVVALSA